MNLDLVGGIFDGGIVRVRNDLKAGEVVTLPIPEEREVSAGCVDPLDTFEVVTYIATTMFRVNRGVRKTWLELHIG